MVIICPSCKRKYQIDTSRIPAAGTSFTCWSCRASVHVEAPGGTPGSLEEAAGHQFLPGEIRSGSGKLPPVDAEVYASGSPDDTSVPPSAMRFFESLAAEATLNKQMETEQPSVPPMAAAPPVAIPRPSGGPPTPPDVIRQMFENPAAANAAAPEPPAVTVRSDAFGGDEILELPSLDPIVPPGPPHLNNVLEIDGPAADAASAGAPAVVPEKTVRTAPIVSERRPAPFRTEPMYSPEPSGDTLGLASPFAPTVDRTEPRGDAPPRLTPPPRPIVLPDRTPTIAPLAASNAPAVPPPVEPFAPPQPVTPPAFASAPIEPFAPPLQSEPPSAEPAFGSGVVNRQTPAEVARQAELAQQYVTPWVAPEVEETPRPSGRRVGPLTLLALLAAAGILFVVWKLGIQDGINPKPAQPPQATAPAPASQPAASSVTSPAPSTATPSGAQQTATTPQAQPPATEAPKPPAGSGGFTIQVRSSPNEGDSAAFANSLKGAGFDAYVLKADLGAKGTWYRVRVGRYDSKAEAQQALGKLRASAQVGDAIIQAYETP